MNRPTQLRESLHRLPPAATVQTAQGAASYLLGYDQVGSLKAVAAMDGPHEGRVVKVVDYDAFGQILSDSNPALFMPIAFAGGLRDKFTGLVRFCHRDYDPTIGRFTAPDPLGDTGGDHDLYDYCVDDPVGRVDPEGLKEKTAHGQGNRPLTLDEDLLRMTTVATPANTSAHDSTHSTMPDRESDWWTETDRQGPTEAPCHAGGDSPDTMPGGRQTTGELPPLKEPGAIEKMAGWIFGNPRPNPADVAKGAVSTAADAAQAVTKSYDDLRTAGAQVKRNVPEAINNLPVSPKEVGVAVNVLDKAQQVGAVVELDKIAREATANATAFEKKLNEGLSTGDIKKIETVQDDQEAYFNILGWGALRKGSEIAPTPVGPGPLKR